MLTDEEKRARNYARTKAWRKKNPGYRTKESAKYRLKHPENCSRWTMAWRSKPENQKRWKIYMQAYERANKERRRGEKLKHRYGITLEEYASLLEAQDGKCAICHQEYKLLHVDHCHNTGIVRGLLCNGCNRILGFAADNPSRLRAAAEYLERNNNAN